MNTSRLRIAVHRYRELAETIGVGPLEETLRRLPMEADFVRKLFALPPQNMFVVISKRETVGIDAKQGSCILAGIEDFQESKKFGLLIAIRFSVMYGPKGPKFISDLLGSSYIPQPITSYDRSVTRIHELAHVFVRMQARKILWDATEGIALYAEKAYRNAAETDAWLRDAQVNENPMHAWERFTGDNNIFLPGYRFFKSVADELGAPAAFRRVVLDQPKEYEIADPGSYLERVRDSVYLLAGDRNPEGTGIIVS